MGAKRLGYGGETTRVENRGETTRGETSWGRNVLLPTIAQIRSHVNSENNFREARAKKVRFYFVTLKLHESTCYVNWAILIRDLVVGCVEA